MGRLGKITRRTLLIGSAAVAGGVAFGVYTVRRAPDNPLLDDLGKDEASFNPWVKIGPDGVTLVAPHTDLGQGARSMQAALIAEELDLAWGQFRVIPGPPAKAYWNTANGEEAVPVLPGDEKGAGARIMTGIVDAVMKVAGMQVTGGSSSVPDSFDKLREAGAVARETLKQAAADRTGVPRSQLDTRDGHVLLPDGARLAYTELAEAAARLEPVRDVTLRAPDQWRLIGKPMPRLDMVAKSTGTQEYGIDLREDGMVYATVRFNPRQGGIMKSFDASAAKSMPGVKHILEVTNGVAVVADNTWNAFQAADAVDCDWGPAPYPPEMADHWRILGESFTEERLDKEWRHEGDVPAALAGGGALEAEYRAPYLAHAPLEPIGALVTVTDQRADIRVGHQIPRIAQQMVADIAGLPEEAVHLHNQYVGGSFGHRLEFENVRYAAEVASQLRGTPVKLTFRREEDFAHDFPRQVAMSRMAGTVAGGRVEALDLSIASPAVIRSQFGRMGLSPPGPDSQIAAGAWNAPYDLPNLRVRAYAVPGLAPTSSWRSVGASVGGFFVESALDELIHAAGADPLAERLRLCRDPVSRKVLETVGELSDWGASLPAGTGKGVALVHSFGVPVAEVVQVRQTGKGLRIEKAWVAADVGRVVDPVNFENQVQGAVVWGLGHAMNCEITYADGMAEQKNYDSYPAMRLNQCPKITVRGLENGAVVKGVGEPPVPPAAPALANAIFAATGQRLREMPFKRFVDFA